MTIAFFTSDMCAILTWRRTFVEFGFMCLTRGQASKVMVAQWNDVSASFFSCIQSLWVSILKLFYIIMSQNYMI